MKLQRKSILFAVVLTVTAIVLILTLPSQALSSSQSVLKLDQYKIVANLAIKNVENGLSGITYSSRTNTLIAVISRPPSIIELDLEGKLLRNIELANFSDTEGIAYIRDDLYAISQERRRRVTFVRITPETTILDAGQSKSIDLPSDRNDKNRGLEGIVWSPARGLFVANEKDPCRVTKLPLSLLADLDQGNTYYDDTSLRHFDGLPLDDISGLHIVEHSKRLVVLSDESSRLAEVDFNGNVQSEFKFTRGRIELFNHIRQPEGVTMDNNGRLYVVGEPNAFLVMEPS